MAKQEVRRHEIERLRQCAERHRQVAQSFHSEEDARAAYEEALAVERQADELEVALREAQGENIVLFSRTRPR